MKYIQKQKQKLNKYIFNFSRLLEYNEEKIRYYLKSNLSLDEFDESFYIKNENLELEDYLYENIDFKYTNDPLINKIFKYIDYNGFLDLNYFEDKEFGNFDEKLELLEKFKRISNGIGSIDLKDYLAFQITDSISKKIILNDFQSLLNGNFKKIGMKYKIDKSYIKNILLKIKTLNYSPLNLGIDSHKYLIPDLYIKKYKEKIIVEFNEYNYIVDKNLCNILLKRKEIMEKISFFLVDYQKEYFYNNKEIKPISYKEISEKTKYNISTIRRYAKNKNFEFENEIKPLSFLIGKVYDDKYTKEKIKKEIRNIIENNYKLSDSSISKIMYSKLNIKIHTRLVNKYRLEMGLPNSYVRRFLNE